MNNGSNIIHDPRETGDWSIHFVKYKCPIEGDTKRVAVDMHQDDIESGATVETEIAAAYDTYLYLRDDDSIPDDEEITLENILYENGVYYVSFKSVTINVEQNRETSA